MPGILVGQVVVRTADGANPENRPRLDWRGMLLAFITTGVGGPIAAIGYWLAYGPSNTAGITTALVTGISVGSSRVSVEVLVSLGHRVSTGG
jgi:hypothetical protein